MPQSGHTAPHCTFDVIAPVNSWPSSCDVKGIHKTNFSQEETCAGL